MGTQFHSLGNWDCTFSFVDNSTKQKQNPFSKSYSEKEKGYYYTILMKP